MIRQAIEPQVFEFFDYKRYTFSLGLRNDRGAWLSGHSASRYDDRLDQIVVTGEMKQQAGVAYDKIETLLKAAGLSWQNVVKMNDYVTVAGLGTYDIVSQVRKERLGSHLPAVTPVIVDRLLRAGALLEIEVIASAEPSKVFELDVGVAAGGRAAAVRIGDLIYVSGQVGVDESGEIARGDLIEQTRQVYRNLDAVLNAAGVSTKQIVKTIDYLVWSARDSYRETAAVRREFLAEPYPAATGIVVNRLQHGDALIQVDAFAYDGDRESINPGWPVEGLTYSPGVRAGDYVFLEGMFAADPVSLESQFPGDIVGQTRYAYQNLLSILDAAGLNESAMMKTVEYVVGTALSQYRGTAKVRQELFSAPYPSATGCVIPQLLRPDMLIEIDSVAMVR